MTSNENTQLDLNVAVESSLFQTDDKTSVKDEALEAVQRELLAECDARKEERFVWMCVVILLFDIFSFKDMESWSGPIIIGIIQVIFIVAVGRKWGMDHIWTITERLVDKWDGKFIK
jgi:hypothetical protein